MSIDLNKFEHLFEQYYDSIKIFVYYKTGVLDVSEDIAQETFIKLWERKNEIDFTTVKSLLYTIASNLSKNHIKHQNVVLNFASKQILNNSTETPQQLLEASEFEIKLKNAISSLSDTHRETFLMNRIEQFTYTEIAERLEVSIKTVEKRMSVTLKKLYNLLGHKL